MLARDPSPRPGSLLRDRRRPPRVRAPRVEQAGDAARVVGLVLERLELGLAEGVVVGPVLVTDALADAERAEELRQRVTLHRGATVGVHGEAGFDPMACDGLREARGGQVAASPPTERP